MVINYVIRCKTCNKRVSLRVTLEELTKYFESKNVYLSFPNLTADERLTISTNLCNNCFFEDFTGGFNYP